jgi:hypothetical protein
LQEQTVCLANTIFNILAENNVFLGIITGNVAWREAEGSDIIQGCAHLYWEEIQNAIVTRNNVQGDIRILRFECCRKESL